MKSMTEEKMKFLQDHKENNTENIIFMSI